MRVYEARYHEDANHQTEAQPNHFVSIATS